MKKSIYLVLLCAFLLPACGGSEDPAPDANADPLEQVPDADAAAAEADAINADNADQAMSDIEKELEGE